MTEIAGNEHVSLLLVYIWLPSVYRIAFQLLQNWGNVWTGNQIIFQKCTCMRIFCSISVTCFGLPFWKCDRCFRWYLINKMQCILKCDWTNSNSLFEVRICKHEIFTIYSAVHFFWLIDHRLNRNLKNRFFFRFSEISIMFDRSGNDRKIDFFFTNLFY